MKSANADANSRKLGPNHGKSPGKPNIIRKIYDWLLRQADHPKALWILFGIAFIESSVFPIPPDILLIGIVLGNRKHWLRAASICLVGSVIGGMAGYGIGAFFWDTAGIWIVETLIGIDFVSIDGRQDIALPGYMASLLASWLDKPYLFSAYDQFNAWIVFIFGFTPLPYKLVTITAGMAKVDFVIFTIASVLSRGLRFYLVAYFIKLFGAAAKTFIERYFNALTILFVVALIGGFAVLKLIF